VKCVGRKENMELRRIIERRRKEASASKSGVNED